MSILDPKADAAAFQPVADEIEAKIAATAEEIANKLSASIVSAVQAAETAILAVLPHLLDGYIVSISQIVVSPITIKVTKVPAK